MRTTGGALYIGTSGWTYADWRRRFYPEDIARKSWLAWYAKELASTEINGSRYVFEFRHASWYEAPILSLLRTHNVALCFSDHHEAPAPWTVTARHVYVRGHGPTGRYKGHYPDKTLQDWAARIRAWRRQRRAVYVFFDNDQKSAAPKDAKRHLSLLGQA